MLQDRLTVSTRTCITLAGIRSSCVGPGDFWRVAACGKAVSYSSQIMQNNAAAREKSGGSRI